MTSIKTITVLSGAIAWMSLAQPGFAVSSRVPEFNVKESCKAAETYDFQEDREKTFQGCMQDEDQAHVTLNKNWSQYKVKDRQDCVDQGARVSPSYVEILTCLEMTDETGNLLSKDVNQPTGAPAVSEPAPTVQPAMKPAR
jgi:hypothetical protein